MLSPAVPARGYAYQICVGVGHVDSEKDCAYATLMCRRCEVTWAVAYASTGWLVLTMVADACGHGGDRDPEEHVKKRLQPKATCLAEECYTT